MNKTQLKIKNIFFILLGRTWFNAFLALNRNGSAGTGRKATREQWSMVSWVFSSQEAATSCFL
jgi:hypothetical protein